MCFFKFLYVFVEFDTAKQLADEFFKQFLRSYIKNRMGPNTDPWGTPLMTRAIAEWIPLMATNCFRSTKNCFTFIHENSLPFISYRLSSCRRI